VEILTTGKFEPVLEDPPPAGEARRLILTAGKVYHDLMRRRAELQLGDVAVVRVAQLYPLAERTLSDLADRYPRAELVWCQEEPENQGAYRFLFLHLRRLFGREPAFAGRQEAAAPATGSLKIHQREQNDLVDRALGV
jgi:2-oxoglutarate dehydrogenase E1 component